LAAIETVIPGLRENIGYMQVAARQTFTHSLRSADGSIYLAARGQWTPPPKAQAPGLILFGGGGLTAGTIAANLIAPLIAASGKTVCHLRLTDDAGVVSIGITVSFA
jgi:hypothetical protein